MHAKYNYKKKHVHDITIGDSFVRLWQTDGAYHKKEIINAFQTLLKTPFVFPYIALMPDYHQSGENMIGSVIPTRNVILPSVIGNDIGCGMLVVKLPVTVHDLKNPYEILAGLKKAIPVGTDQNKFISERVQNNPIWNNDNLFAIKRKDLGKLIRQFGTLGGGNHFLEILDDTEGNLWILIHSGSRNSGSLIKNYYITSGSRNAGIDQNLFRKIPYLIADTTLAFNYLTDYSFAVNYAKENRMEMMLRTLDVLSEHLILKEKLNINNVLADHFDVIHNSVSKEIHFDEELFVHRKGAINILPGNPGVIPGSMGDSSFIVEGRNNVFSFNSCSHGAGRVMSRGEAFRTISERDFQKSMSGIIYDKTINIKDEAPQAYKDIRHVLRAQKDSVKILFELNPLISLKG